MFSFCSSDEPKGREILTLRKRSQTYRIGESYLGRSNESTKHFHVMFFYLSDMLLRVLLIVQQLLQENRHGSKRDIYYMHPSAFKGKFWKDIIVPLVISVFENDSASLFFLCSWTFSNAFFVCSTAQSVVDRAIADICNLFQCSRYSLNVVSIWKYCSPSIWIYVITLLIHVIFFAGVCWKWVGTFDSDYSASIMRPVLVLRSTLCCRLVMGWLKFREAGRKFDCLSSLNTVRLEYKI